MTWIKVDQNLLSHKKLYKLATILKISEFTAAGHLVALWSWSMQNAKDGIIHAEDIRAIEINCWRGKKNVFIPALISSKFLEQIDEFTFLLHDWEEYGGKLNEVKIKNAERVRKYRSLQTREMSGDVMRTQRECNNQETALRNIADKIRLEKIREKHEHEIAYSAPFLEFWTAYPRRENKGTAWKAWCKLEPDKTVCKKILAAIEQRRNSPQWQKENGQYIPHPATWLSQRRWEDEVENGNTETDNDPYADLYTGIRL